MRRWQAPARVLPVTLRPFGGETLPSYTRRLAQANALPAATVLLALGDLQPGTGPRLLTMDGVLNRAAQHRLEALTGISRHRLLQALPALTSWHHRPLPTDRPAIFFRQCIPRPQPACTSCIARRASAPALVHPAPTRMVCRRHHRWLGQQQYELHRLPAVLAAFARYRRLHHRHDPDHPGWIEHLYQEALTVVEGWTRSGLCRHSDLVHRWNLRAEALNVTVAEAIRVITLPETVTVAEIMSDLRWRMRLAIRPHSEHRGFYRLVAARLGVPDDRDITAGWRRPDPLRGWVDYHRWRYRTLRPYDEHSIAGLAWTGPDLDIEHFR